MTNVNTELLDALRDLIGIGKRDLSNRKYDPYFDAAREAITRAEAQVAGGVDEHMIRRLIILEFPDGMEEDFMSDYAHGLYHKLRPYLQPKPSEDL